MKTWKVQKFFGDLVYDLRSRGLLPIAALLVVGMLAIPVLLSRGGSDAPAGAPSGVPSAAELAPENQTAVLAYNPGLRDYKERLSDLQSKDPFIQQFSGADVAATSLEQDVSPTSTDVATAPTGGSGGSGGGGTEIEIDDGKGEGKGGGKGGGKSGTRYVYYETDIRVGEKDLTERVDDVDEFSFLPSETAPVLVFLGASADGKRGVFLVAKDVISATGSGVCFPAPESCQLLALKEGESFELVYAIDNKTYSVTVVKIHRVVSSKSPG